MKYLIGIILVMNLISGIYHLVRLKKSTRSYEDTLNKLR